MNKIIPLDSEKAIQFGFTSDRFSGWLREADDFVWISFIVSKEPGKGNLKMLFDTIEKNGYKIIVPTPSNRMVKICMERGMVKTNINTPHGVCECMMMPEKKY
jgi:hypothetical protein